MIKPTIVIILLTILSGATAFAMGALVNKPAPEQLEPLEEEEESTPQP